MTSKETHRRESNIKMKAEIGVIQPQAKATEGCYLALEKVKIYLALGPPEGTCLVASLIWVLVSRMV